MKNVLLNMGQQPAVAVEPAGGLPAALAAWFISVIVSVALVVVVSILVVFYSFPATKSVIQN